MQTTRSSGDNARQPGGLRRILAGTALAAAVPVAAGVVFFAGAGTAAAPEPAQLNYDLSSTWEHATYVSTHQPTYGFQLSKNWIYHSWMGRYAGYPCTNFNAPAGTILPGYIVASGNYVRCAGF